MPAGGSSRVRLRAFAHVTCAGCSGDCERHVAPPCLAQPCASCCRTVSDRYGGDSFQTSIPAPSRTWIDIDAISSLLGCPHYVVPIFEHLREAEVRICLIRSRCCITSQRGINFSSRLLQHQY